MPIPGHSIRATTRRWLEVKYAAWNGVPAVEEQDFHGFTAAHTENAARHDSFTGTCLVRLINHKPCSVTSEEPSSDKAKRLPANL